MRRACALAGLALGLALAPSPGDWAPLIAVVAVWVLWGPGCRGVTGRAPRRPRSTDPLTGLADAAAFRAFVHAELDGAERALGVVFFELRQSALLRTTFGREAVEIVCSTVANRLRSAARGEDGVAHFGEGVFAVAVTNARDRAAFNAAAERLRDELARPILICGTRVRPTWDAAGALAPEAGRCAADLLAAAEAARELAPVEPGRGLRSLGGDPRAAVRDRSRRQRELLEAVEQGAFFPLFQPQLDLATGGVDRAEVLMRWQRTDGSVAAPGAFLDQLRALDALPRVSRVVYATALAEAAVWREAGFAVDRLAFNLDASQVTGADWAAGLLALIHAGPLPATAVEVEVSENILAGTQLDRLVTGLEALRRAGVRVSLDDFGTGYASLTQIAGLPIDLVKLDSRLLWDAAHGRRHRLVVEGVVDLLHTLELPCLVEGVETPAHLALARSLGARWAQGYLIGRPMPAPDLEGRLYRPERVNRSTPLRRRAEVLSSAAPAPQRR